jgi:hypothetical protein
MWLEATLCNCEHRTEEVQCVCADHTLNAGPNPAIGSIHIRLANQGARRPSTLPHLIGVRIKVIMWRSAPFLAAAATISRALLSSAKLRISPSFAWVVKVLHQSMSPQVGEVRCPCV